MRSLFDGVDADADAVAGFGLPVPGPLMKTTSCSTSWNLPRRKLRAIGPLTWMLALSTKAMSR